MNKIEKVYPSLPSILPSAQKNFRNISSPTSSNFYSIKFFLFNYFLKKVRKNFNIYKHMRKNLLKKLLMTA